MRSTVPISDPRKVLHVCRFRYPHRTRSRRDRGPPGRARRCPHRRSPARRRPRRAHRRSDPSRAGRAQGDLLPGPAPPRRRVAVRVRRVARHTDHRAPDGDVARGARAAHRLRLRHSEQLAHRRLVRRPHPEGVDPARGGTAPLRWFDHVGLRRGGLRGPARTAEDTGREPVGHPHQRVRLRGRERRAPPRRRRRAGRRVPRRVPVRVLRDRASRGAGAPRDRGSGRCCSATSSRASSG